jgi:hypothetical protein
MMAFTNANALFTHHQIPGNLAFTNFDADVDQHHPTIVGPQLAMPMYPYDVVDDRPAGQFIFNKYVWDPPMDEADGSLAFFGPLDAANQHCNNPDMHVSNTGQVDMSDAATTASLETGDSPPFSSKSPNSSQSSAVRKRMAASKCCQKKKQWMQELEDTKADLEKSHRALQGSYNSTIHSSRRGRLGASFTQPRRFGPPPWASPRTQSQPNVALPRAAAVNRLVFFLPQ